MTSEDRKGSGSFYTPKPITKFITETSINYFIIEKSNNLLNQTLPFLKLKKTKKRTLKKVITLMLKDKFIG